MGNSLNSRRKECLRLFEMAQLRCDQISFMVSINHLWEPEKFLYCRTKKEFTKEAIKHIKTCDEETLDKIIKYLANLNSENDITGGSVHI